MDVCVLVRACVRPGLTRCLQPHHRFNARELFNDLNIFRGLTHNPIFISIIFITVALQVSQSPSDTTRGAGVTHM